MKLNENKIHKVLLKILEFLLVAYIIFVPLIKSFTFWILGNAIHVYISILIIFLSLLLRFLNFREKNNMFFSMALLVVFVVEIVLQLYRGDQFDVSLLLMFGLYIAFMSLPSGISLKSIYYAYYISFLAAAVFTIIKGYSDDEVIRTGGSVDGSIGVVAMTIFLFLKEDFKPNKLYKLLKLLSLPAAVIILGFGMSRVRLLLAVILFAAKCIMVAMDALSKGRIKAIYLLAVPLLVFGFFLLFRYSVAQIVADEINMRFEGGLQSEARDIELAFAWNLFREYPLFGAGYGFIRYDGYTSALSLYYNHNMYVAILARGGLALAIPLFTSFIVLFNKVLRCKNLFIILLTVCFFILGYGNAGLFNLTIVSFFIPIVLGLRKGEKLPDSGETNENHVLTKRKS